MNRTISSLQWLLVACTALWGGQAAADGVAVVPGKTNGYFYDLASNQPADGKEISLVVKKMGHFKEYIVESVDSVLRCDQTCPETSQRLPAGSVSLKIIGKKPISFMNIPLAGKWSEPCNNTATETDECVFSLNEMNGFVSVEVSPDIEVGTTLALPDGGEGLIVKVDAREGYILVAGHEKLGTGKRWLAFNPDWKSNLNINSPTDGRINTEKLLNIGKPSAAADHCELMAGGEWYLPAERELALLTKEALQKIPGIDENGYLWSSTENRLFQSNQKGNGRPYLELEAKALRNSTARIEVKDVYSYDQGADGSWKEDARYTSKLQVLCFRRLVF